MIEVADARLAMDDLVAARMGSGGMHAPNDDSDPFAVLDNLYRMELVKKKLSELRDAYNVAKQDGEEPSPVGHFVFSGAPGTERRLSPGPPLAFSSGSA